MAAVVSGEMRPGAGIAAKKTPGPSYVGRRGRGCVFEAPARPSAGLEQPSAGHPPQIELGIEPTFWQDKEDGTPATISLRVRNSLRPLVCQGLITSVAAIRAVRRPPVPNAIFLLRGGVFLC